MKPDLTGALAPLLPPRMRTVFLGVGSELCRDDYAGMAVIERLRPCCGEDLLVIGGGGAPENCTGEIRRFRPGAVIVIDAAHMGLAPGEYALLDPKKIVGATFCTHMLPLPVTLSYLETLCGCVTAYLGIQPASTEQGIGMCPQVQAGVERLSRELIAALGKG